MKPTTPRQRTLVRTLRALVPQAPYADFDEIAEAAKAKHLRELEPPDAAFLTIVAHIRHRLTDYDELLEQGYDRDSARHFVVDEIDDVLRRWGCSRSLDTSPEPIADAEDDDQPG